MRTWTWTDDARITVAVPVTVRSVDSHGLTLWGLGERVLDVCFDGRRVWSFWLVRDTTRAGGGRHHVEWPSALRPFLDGITRLSVVEHVSGRLVHDQEHHFGESSARIAVVGRTGSPMALDKSNRLTATFVDRTESDVGPLLDAIELLIGLIGDAGVEAFPSYGTLLGAVREGTFLGHDSDADLAYVSRYDRPVDAVRENFRLQRRISEQGLPTHRYSGLAFRVDIREADGVVRGLDVFGGFIDDGRLYVMGEIGTDFKEEWVFPLGTCQLAGRTLPAPANTDAWLSATYGAGWRVPDPAFQFETSERTVAQLTGWFRGTAPGRQAWERTYSGRSRARLPGRKPSRLARMVLGDLRAGTPEGLGGTRVLDVGAGKAGDSWWLARRGVPVTAYDYAPRGADAVQARAAKRSLDLDVRYLNLTEWRSVISEGARVSRMDGSRAMLARHVADTTDAFGRDSLFRFASMGLRGGGRLYLDVWSGRGRAPKKLRPVPLEPLVELAERHGAGIVSAQEIEPHSDGDGQAYGIGRLVAQWD